MKRWLRVAFVVLAAATCSIASAILPVVVDPYLPQAESKPAPAARRLSFTPDGFPDSSVMWITSRTGFLRESTIRGIGIEDSWHVERLSAGWPIRMVEGGDYYEFHNTGGKPATAEMHPVWMYQWHSGKHLWRFPLRPMPLALAGNLAFWIFVCASFAWGIPAVRRWRRRRTQRCETCGYPATDEGPCPECGAARA
jgi:hypothetical protein